MQTLWTCPYCRRQFARANQRHRCGVGDRREVLRNRPDSLVALYQSLESFVKTLGPVEFVARERYVLLRTTRVFADLVVMKDALRIAVHLNRRVKDPLFFKVVADRRHITHVARLQDEDDLSALKPRLREAYDCSIAK